MRYSNLLSQFHELRHGFGTRDDAVAPPPERVSLKQIHSDVVWVAREPGLAGEGDALISNQAGLELAVRTADCYPVLLADMRRHAVAAIHAGWRGTAAGIVRKAIEKMTLEFGTDPSDLYAAIGPGIGICCFEVGAEVARLFDRSCVAEGDGDTDRAKPSHVNLAAANRRQLIESGVAPLRIDVSGLCTFCEAGLLYSYRREKQQGRTEMGRMISSVKVT